MNKIEAALKRMRPYTSLELSILKIVAVNPPARGALWYKGVGVPAGTEGWHTDEIDEQMVKRAQAAGVEPEPVIESLTLLHFADDPLLEHPATGASASAQTMHVLTELGHAYLEAVKSGQVKIKTAASYDAARLKAAARLATQPAEPATAPTTVTAAPPAAPKRGRGRPRKDAAGPSAAPGAPDAT
jgi:hypothetical protein